MFTHQEFTMLRALCNKQLRELKQCTQTIDIVEAMHFYQQMVYKINNILVELDSTEITKE